MTTKKLTSIAECYLKTWEHHNLTALQQNLDQNFLFKEPLTEISGRKLFVDFANGNMKFVKEVRILSSFESNNEVVIIYDFVFIDPIGSQKTTAHFVFNSELIQSIELFYDPRHLEKMISMTQEH